MAVRSGQDAVRTISRLLTGTAGLQDLLADLSTEGVSAVAPAPDGERSRWLLGRGPATVGGWGDPASYALVGDPALRARLTGTVPADLGTLAPEDQEAYVRRSVDLAMRGGTTSAVVYPFAVCEIARGMRVRNVGGSSAGAVAAACTAAAELGRSTGREGAPPGPGAGPGHLRGGFSGLADVVSWLLQLDGAGRDDRPGPGKGPDELRLAQLFRPARSQQHVFALAVAVLRGRYWAVPLALARAAGPWAAAALAVLVVVAALALGLTTDPLLAPALLAGALVVLGGLLGGTGLGLTWWQRRRSRPGQPTPLLQRLAEGASSAPAVAGSWRPAVGAAALVAAALGAAATGTVLLGVPTVVQTLAVTLSLVLLAVLVIGAATLRWVLTAGERGYGVVPGSTPPGRVPLLSRLVGTPAAMVERALVPWLADGLSELAGMPGTVLRFGHLWQGPGFEPLPESDDGAATAAEALVRGLAAAPARRLVNLEVMTTDLGRRRPWTFPLAVAGPSAGPSVGPDAGPSAGEALWFASGDLCAALATGGAAGVDVLPREVVEAMTALVPRRTVPLADGSGPVTLYRLPHPWNLPVVLAVRISLALPVLFTAVRLYRLVSVDEVRDDLGRTLHADGAPVPTQAHPVVAEPSWWSDGGITSNFPLHLFDSVLPRWPSLGLDLGDHPPGQPLEDVRLPQDWDGHGAPTGPLGGGLVALLGAALGAATSWRDTLQASLPGFRSRVAAVREHPGEGGVNLFVPRGTVAALALRGAVAGARLRERFADDAQWDRHRWVRLRVAATALEDLRARVVRARPGYDALLAEDGLGLRRLAQQIPGDPTLPPEPAWYAPVDEFWAHVAAGLDALSRPVPDPPLVDGGPEPEPTFSLTPPT